MKNCFNYWNDLVIKYKTYFLYVTNFKLNTGLHVSQKKIKKKYYIIHKYSIIIRESILEATETSLIYPSFEFSYFSQHYRFSISLASSEISSITPDWSAGKHLYMLTFIDTIQMLSILSWDGKQQSHGQYSTKLTILTRLLLNSFREMSMLLTD